MVNTGGLRLLFWMSVCCLIGCNHDSGDPGQSTVTQTFFSYHFISDKDEDIRMGVDVDGTEAFCCINYKKGEDFILRSSEETPMFSLDLRLKDANGTNWVSDIYQIDNRFDYYLFGVGEVDAPGSKGVDIRLVKSKGNLDPGESLHLRIAHFISQKDSLYVFLDDQVVMGMRYGELFEDLTLDPDQNQVLAFRYVNDISDPVISSFSDLTNTSPGYYTLCAINTNIQPDLNDPDQQEVIWIVDP